MKISDCVSYYALYDALRALSAQQFYTALEEPEIESAAIAILRAAGCTVERGSGCPDHPQNGYTILVPEGGWL